MPLSRFNCDPPDPSASHHYGHGPQSVERRRYQREPQAVFLANLANLSGTTKVALHSSQHRPSILIGAGLLPYPTIGPPHNTHGSTQSSFQPQ